MGRVFFQGHHAKASFPSLSDQGLVTPNGRTLIALPIFAGGRAGAVLGVESKTEFEFNKSDLNRLQALTSLVAYEVFQLDAGNRSRSRTSENLGAILQAARKELGQTQEELASVIGTSRIAVSMWEIGSQPPSRGLVRRWAQGLGLLGGGERNLISVIDATPQLLEVLKHDPRRLSELSPEQFEAIVADRLNQMGYLVERTGNATAKDGGIDIIAMSKAANAASHLFAVQVKHHRTELPTGRDAVDRLLALQNSPFRLGMLVTNTRFTRDALWAASKDPAKHFLRLRDFKDLSRWLRGIFESDEELTEIPDFVELAPGVRIRIPKPTFEEASRIWPLNGPFCK